MFVMLHVLNTLAPIFLVIGLGYGLARRRFLSRTMIEELNRLLFWVCLPALIVHSLATVSRIPSGTGTTFLTFTSATLIVTALSALLSKLMRLEPSRGGAFVQAAFRGNLAYAGIPIILFSLQDQPKEMVAETLAMTIFVFAPTMLVYNAVSVVALVASHQLGQGGLIPGMLNKMARNPLILAALAGIALFLLPWQPPRFILNSLDLIAQLSAPASLFCVGGAMAQVSMRGRIRTAAIAALLKVVILPLTAWGLAEIAGLTGPPRLVLLVLSACPTAVASYILAKELNGDEALAAGAIVVSTAACAPALALIIALA